MVRRFLAIAPSLAARQQIRAYVVHWQCGRMLRESKTVCNIQSRRQLSSTNRAHNLETAPVAEAQATGLTITDPLVLYRLYVDSGRIRPDEAQHRAAIEFQKLYYRVKDYVPSGDFQRQVDKLSQLLEVHCRFVYYQRGCKLML